MSVLIGSQIKTKAMDTQFTLASFIIIFIVGVISAWQLGPFPFYTDMPIASGFFFGLIGIFVGKYYLTEEIEGFIMFVSTNTCDGKGNVLNNAPQKLFV